MGRLLTIATAAGPGAFVVQRFSGREALARLSEFHVELLSERSDLSATSLLGTNATVALERDGLPPRFFNGYITRFVVRGPSRTPAFGGGAGFRYDVVMNPAAWFLTRRSDSRIFRDRALGPLLVERLAEGGLQDVVDQLGDSEWREQVVQYRETDFNFASRLAEHIGASWFFLHEDGRHRLVLTDRPGAGSAGTEAPVLRFSGDAGDVITDSFELASEVQAGAWSGTDYHYGTPRTRLDATDAHPEAHDNAAFELFDAPMETRSREWTQRYARIRREEISCRHAVARGATVERSLQVGLSFRVEGHPMPSLDGDWLLIAQSLTALNNLGQSGLAGGGEFHADIEAVRQTVPFRPARLTPRPRIAGTQSARVVGDVREDVRTTRAAEASAASGDRLGRVRLAFFWDRREEASAWARVSQPWAGRGYGFQNLPRLGEEVLVQFDEGVPDRPVVMGRVHNGDQRPPYALPRQAAVTGLRTASCDGEGRLVAGRFNELRFDDTAGAEQVYLQAQNDLDVRVMRHRHGEVGGDSHLVVRGDQRESCHGARHIGVDGDVRATVGGAVAWRAQGDLLLRSTGGRAALRATDEIHLDGGRQIVLEATERLTLRVGASVVVLDASGVHIDGPLVALRCGANPGAGHGCDPPTASPADEAMHSESGRAPLVPQRAAPPPASDGRSSSHRVAADTAAPFCAVCDGC